MGFLVQFDVCFFGIFPQRLVLHPRYRPQNMKAVPAIIVLKIKIHGKVNVKILENDTLTTFRDSRGFEGPQSRIVVHAKAGHTSWGTTRKRRFAICPAGSIPDRELLSKQERSTAVSICARNDVSRFALPGVTRIAKLPFYQALAKASHCSPGPTIRDFESPEGW